MLRIFRLPTARGTEIYNTKFLCGLMYTVKNIRYLAGVSGFFCSKTSGRENLLS